MDNKYHGAATRYAPLIVHLCFYTATCLIGALLFYYQYGPFLILVDYFSGINVPLPYPADGSRKLLLLLLGAPLLFSAGYALAVRFRFTPLETFVGLLSGAPERRIPTWFPVVVFLLSALAGAISLARSGAFVHFGAWSNYGVWVQARWALFDQLGFFSFANLYTVLAVAAAWVILACPLRGLAGWGLRCSCLAVMMTLAFFLFQKRVLVTSALFIVFAVILNHVLAFGWERRVKRLLGVSIGLIACLYFVLVVAPVYLESTQTADEIIRQTAEQVVADIAKEDATVELHAGGSAQAEHEVIKKALQQSLAKPAHDESEAERQAKNQQRAQAINELIGKERNFHVFFYSLLAPMTRTSAPAMFYPIVFPYHHPLYGFDAGQDILGVGFMPDDNKVVWEYMYPNTPGGSVAAPFQFVLYSQVGVAAAMALSLVLGAVIGALWRIVIYHRSPQVWRSLMGSVLLMFSGYVALDSMRGSLLASYGAIWGWLFVIAAFWLGGRLEGLGMALRRYTERAGK